MTTSLDTLAIRELVDAWHAAVNLRDISLLHDAFEPSAVWEVLAPVNLRHEGRDAILKGLQESMGRQELLVQLCSGLVVTLRGDSAASAVSTLVEQGRETKESAPWMAIAFYRDELVKRDGRWRFATRSLHVRYLGPLDLRGTSFPTKGLDLPSFG
ncbi:MAG TPA: nuclear transport factor 2 family protein [Ideonella sp.]|uniref:nuclear transport factor 2 family protein n=1 Tax=Ideonella sp. TaxID=1929293 RepID=UPI002C689C40|nr:nuclear transport factor 2 family protein [Ideonella sp.]HSI47933.1 nuclear transport factor 2 family protein [Ideonella sp.]